jgi:hypothetical protein
MGAQGRAAFAQALRFRRAETEQGLLHPLVQQDGVDLVGEAAVEPGRQAAHLGALGRVGGHQEGRLLLILDPAQDGVGLAQGQRVGPGGSSAAPGACRTG